MLGNTTRLYFKEQCALRLGCAIGGHSCSIHISNGMAERVVLYRDCWLVRIELIHVMFILQSKRINIFSGDHLALLTYGGQNSS